MAILWIEWVAHLSRPRKRAFLWMEGEREDPLFIAESANRAIFAVSTLASGRLVIRQEELAIRGW